MDSTGSLRETDIICAQNKHAFNHPGNRRYQKIILLHREAYQNARRREDKSNITHAVIHKVREGGSRFVKLDEATKQWVEIGSDSVHEKVSHALRSSFTKKQQKQLRLQQQQQQQQQQQTNSHRGFLPKGAGEQPFSWQQLQQDQQQQQVAEEPQIKMGALHLLQDEPYRTTNSNQSWDDNDSSSSLSLEPLDLFPRSSSSANLHHHLHGSSSLLEDFARSWTSNNNNNQQTARIAGDHDNSTSSMEPLDISYAATTTSTSMSTSAATTGDDSSSACLLGEFAKCWTNNKQSEETTAAAAATTMTAFLSGEKDETTRQRTDSHHNNKATSAIESDNCVHSQQKRDDDDGLDYNYFSVARAVVPADESNLSDQTGVPEVDDEAVVDILLHDKHDF